MDDYSVYVEKCKVYIHIFYIQVINLINIFGLICCYLFYYFYIYICNLFYFLFVCNYYYLVLLLFIYLWLYVSLCDYNNDIIYGYILNNYYNLLSLS